MPSNVLDKNSIQVLGSVVTSVPSVFNDYHKLTDGRLQVQAILVKIYGPFSAYRHARARVCGLTYSTPW